MTEPDDQGGNLDDADEIEHERRNIAVSMEELRDAVHQLELHRKNCTDKDCAVCVMGQER